MDVKVKEILKYAISAAVACVLLYFSFREVKWDDFIQGLEQCRWGYVLLSMLAGVLAFWLRAVRWRRLIVPIDPDTGMLTVFNAVNIGYISNFVVPRIGEFVRCGVVSRNSEGRRASYEAVLGTVVLERAWDLVSMLILLVVLLVARMDMFGDFFVEKMLGPLSEKLNFSLWWILFCGLAVASAGVWGIWRLHDKNVFCGKIWNFFAGLLQGLSSCLKMKSKWLFLADTVLIWSMYWLMAAATMWAVPELDGLGMVDALFLSIVGSLGWIVPVPGGFGAFHFVVSMALSAIYGIPFSMGIVFATLSHESQAVTMILFGGGSSLYELFRRRSSRS
ncbi:MAG: flippase-like domain-containing protein [Bacteroidales bacterium]|nr:flippase-like domain-containing protein [Bacteroidales bacterium]